MKRLKDFIINEELDDNIFWKIDTYFQNNPIEQKSFNGMVDVCRANKSFNQDTIEAFLTANSSLNRNTKKLLDFLNDDINSDTTNNNYMYSMYNVVKKIIGNKTEGTRFTNLT